MENKNLLRCDFSKFGRVEKNDKGFLQGDAAVTRTGIFLYANPDGTLRRELRHPDDVFDSKSIESMKMIPITDDHPHQRLVDSQNAKDVAVGHVGENIKIDGKNVIAPIAITHDSGIKSVNNGKRELSLGYTADIIDEQGIYDGEPYDARQKNIRYNHLAVVTRGRAGSQARINLDSHDAIQIIENEGKYHFNKAEGDKKMLEKVKIDGLFYDAAPEVKNHFDKLIQKNDKNEKEISELKDKLESITAERDVAKQKLDEHQSKDLNADINKAAKERVKLLNIAEKVIDVKDFDVLYEKDDLEIKKLVIKELMPKAKIDGASDVYIQAYFDAALENQSARVNINDKLSKLVGRPDISSNSSNAEAARQRMIEDIKTSWNRDKKAKGAN